MRVGDDGAVSGALPFAGAGGLPATVGALERGAVDGE